MADIILDILLSFVLLPVATVVLTPIILIGSAFGKESYGKEVAKNYKKVFKWWKRSSYF